MKSYCLILFWLFPSIIYADSEKNDLFGQGNSFSDQGQYAQAIEKYGELVELGVSSKELFYNLGRSYLKGGEKQKATLWFLRSLVLDGDYTPAKLSLSKMITNRDLSKELDRFISPSIWAYLKLILNLLILALVVWVGYQFFQNKKKYIGLLLVGIFSHQLLSLKNTNLANIDNLYLTKNEQPTLYSAPIEGSEKVKSLRAPAVFKMLDRPSENWGYFEGSNGQKGYVPINEFEPLWSRKASL